MTGDPRIDNDSHGHGDEQRTVVAAADPMWPPAEGSAEAAPVSGSWSWQAWVVMLVVGALAGYHAGPWLREVTAGHGFAVLVGGVLGLWVNVILHEAGHALAGLARGMRALAFGIGPIRFERGMAGWQMRWGGGVRGISGFASLIPAGDRPFSKVDQIVFLLGGPLANLLTAGIGLMCFFSMTPGTAASLLLGLSLCAVLLGIGNLLSFESAGWRSDGRNLLAVLRGQPDAFQQFRTLQLMQLSLMGVRPRDWPETLVPEPAEGLSPLLAVNDDLMRLTWAVDRLDHDTSRASAERLAPQLYRVPEAYRPHVAVCMAGYIAVMRPDAQLLAAWLPFCEGGLLDLSPYRAWLHAEHAALRGDHADALAHLQRGRAALGRVTDPASAMVLQDYLDNLAARLPDGVRGRAGDEGAVEV